MNGAEQVLALVGGGLAIAATVYAMIHRIAKIEVRVELLWDFLMDRAKTEANVKGFIHNSPMMITPEVRGLYQPMLNDLRQFYRTIGKSMTDRELFIEIHRRWHDELVSAVCIPLGLVAGSCILVAIELAKEDETLEFNP